MDIQDPLEAERFAALHPDEYQTRRDFLQRTAVAAGLAAGLGLTLDPDTVIAEAARRQRQLKPPSPRDLPIDTFVVLMMENRSFDHYLGWLPGADGRQAGLQYTDSHGHTYATHRLANNYQGCGYLDPDHSWQGGRTELDGGRMDGFLRAQSDVFSIGYYAEPDLPFAPHVANAFTAFDRFFCSLLSSTYPNREYMHAGQSYGMMDNTLPTGSGGFPDTMIFAALSKAGVSNRYFYTDLPVLLFWGEAGLARSSQVQQYYEQAAAGTLPALSFVDPSFNGEDQGTSGDEHPHGDVRVGQAFIADVVHAFMESPQYARGALFIVYDEWGGFFDHVVPPRVPDLRASADINKDFGQMGFRIPAVVVSPYARRGHVDHSIYGFESILKMIRYRYALPPLTPRDLYANNIAAAFDFESTPRPAPELPSPPRCDLLGVQRLLAGEHGRRRNRRRLGDRNAPGLPDRRTPAEAAKAARPPEPAHLGLPGATWVQVPASHPGDDVPPPLEAGDAPLRGARRVAVLGFALAAALPAGLAGADSFTPVRLKITVAPVARLHSPLALTVSVGADPGALDDRSGPLRVRVKLAGECWRAYQYTSGAVLLDKQLSPQPSTGHVYSALARGSGRPTAYGVQTVCVWLDDGAGRTWASDQSTQVDVSPACTTAAARYDVARRHRRKQAAADRRAARRACGHGVPL